MSVAILFLLAALIGIRMQFAGHELLARSEFVVQKQALSMANEVLIFSDFFEANTLANYRIVNSVTWQSNVQNVHLGGGAESDHRLYKTLWFSHDVIISGRLYIPSSGIGPFDTIAMAIRRDDVEYWATLAYGTDLAERNHIGFIRNDSWADLYPLTFTPGWYTVKVQASYQERVLRMKAWGNGNDEPGWQVSIPLDDGWSATEVGFRHFGGGTEVDDLQIFAPAGTVESAALDGRIYCEPPGGAFQALPGVPVKLYTNDGRLFDSQITDGGGYFGLCNWLVEANNQYKLEVCWQNVCRTRTIDAVANQCSVQDFNMCANVATPTPTASPTATSPPTATDTATPTPTPTVQLAPTPTPTPPLPTPTATPSFPTCTVSVDKVAYPSLARKDGQIGVTLRLTGDCPNSEVKAPVDVMLIIDRSQSMCGTKLDQAQAAGKQFLDNMAFPPDQAAVVSFANTAQLHTGLTGNRTQATNALYNIVCGGFSRIDSGLTSAYTEMSGPRRVAGHTPAIILLTDGNPEGTYAGDVRAAAAQIRAAGIALFTIGLGNDVNAALLREIATQPDYYYQSPSPSDLIEIYTRLAGEMRNVSAANIDLIDVVAPEFEIVPNSFSGAAIPQVNGQTLTWKLPQLSEGSTEVGFSVKPTQCGSFAVNRSASAQYDDNRGMRHTLTFPVPTVTVDGCSPDLTDVFIRDNDSDSGQIPSSNPWWVSPDIWIRHADDGGTQHMNPQAGQRNYIYARIWNRGTTTITDIDVDFYFANPGLGLQWPNDWTILPSKQHVTSIAPGGYAVVSIPWDVPNITGHFCLFVRISAPSDPIRDDRVPWENNIAQRNLHIIDYPQPQPGACQLNEAGMYEDMIEFDVINTLATSTPIDIEITASGLPPDAQVWLHPGPLANRWSSLDGLEVEADGRLRVLHFPARVYGVRLNPLESRRVTLEIHAPGNSLFTIGFSEIVRGNVVGGNSYQRWLPPCPINLPIVFGPHPTPTPCPSDQYVPPDVMLVLDRSGSMANEGKMDAAKNAVRIFLSQMDFNQEKAGIASFAEVASLDHVLSQDRLSLEAALNRLVAGGSTAIGEGIAVAQAELESNRHVPGHGRVIVLLSDGHNFAGRDPLAAAASAKAAGIRIITIGLGSDADANLLQQIASSADDYYYAPGPDVLAELYRIIAGTVRCNQPPPNATSTPTYTPTPTVTPTSTTPTPIPPGPPRVIFDGDPRDSAWLCDGGFRSDCDFSGCAKDLRLVWGPFCRHFDYSNVTPGKYSVTIQGQGNVNLGATDFGLTGEMFAFGRYETSLPASFTFCWPGLQPGGFGFEIIVQSKGTDASVSRIKLEHLGVGCD